MSGVRSNPAMLQKPFKIEENKPNRERGSYLAPEAYGQPAERGVEWSRNPEPMKQLSNLTKRIQQRENR